MKRIIFLIIFLLTGCAGNNTAAAPPEYDARALAEIAVEAQADTPALHAVNYEDGYFREYVTNFYGLDSAQISDGAIFYAGGMLATEFAVLEMSGAEAAAEAEDLLNAYVGRRADAFVGYAPFESAMAEESYAVSHGAYVALFLCSAPSSSEAAFRQCFTDEPPQRQGTVVIAEEAQEEAPAEATEETPSPSEATDETPPPSEATAESLPPSDNTPAESLPPSDNTPAESLPPSDNTPAESPPPSDTPAESLPPSESPVESLPPSESPAKSPSPTESPVETFRPVETPVKTPSPTVPPLEALPPTGPPVESHAPNPEDIADGVYDKSAILRAYETGDTSALSAFNLAILEKCEAAFAEIITADMSAYEKELAVHDWICENVEYDPAAHDQGDSLRQDPNNNNPYGALVNGNAICYGYAYTFHLMMEMLGFEVISIDGDSTAGLHAWNMIVMDGNWYCVDVTWDDSYGDLTFFNKSSRYFTNTGHIWPEIPDLPIAERDLA